MVSGACSALGAHPFVASEILCSNHGERGWRGGKCLTEESFLLELCKSRPWGGPRVTKARLRPRARSNRPEMDARAQDPLETDPVQTGDRTWRAGTGIYSSRQPQNQAQDIARQKDLGSVSLLEIINCSPFCMCLGASLVLLLELPDTFLSGPCYLPQEGCALCITHGTLTTGKYYIIIRILQMRRQRVRGLVTCPRSHSQEIIEPGFDLRSVHSSLPYCFL